MSPYPSFPNINAVSPLNGWESTRCEFLVISTPQIDILLSKQCYLIYFKEKKTSYDNFLVVPWLPNSSLNYLIMALVFSLFFTIRKTLETLNAAADRMRVPKFFLV